MYGKKYMGTERTTFVIDPNGRIAAILRKVKPADHAEELRSALTAL
jgi:peroxiredoxin Q/BCP